MDSALTEDGPDLGSRKIKKWAKGGDALITVCSSAAFVAGTVKTEHWLGFGLKSTGRLAADKPPVMFWGNNAFMSKHRSVPTKNSDIPAVLIPYHIFPCKITNNR